ncbi:MAG: fibronectin type III domain-containing protein, partial [Spirochaetes bacterium]|nr:fibronectin type III domain-containing protein [Spirochaetota bacterium]
LFYYFKVKYRENIPPLPPVDIKVLEYNNTIELKWKMNLEQDLKGYMIYWGSESKNYENKVDIGLKNSYIIDSLQSMQNYFFSIKAYDSIEPYNLSGFSKEIHIFKK